MGWAIAGALALLTVGVAAWLWARRVHAFDLLRRRLDLQDHTDWTPIGPTPEGENRYTPQGLTWVEGRLIFANSWKNNRSRVYEIDPAEAAVGRWFDMPPEAVHTSGFAWDGHWLWAVDYISHLCYRIDLEVSFAEGKAVVEGSFRTGLGGSSACCLLEWNGERVLAISDFRNSRTTYFVRHHKALQQGHMRGCVVFTYRNEGFSQGLEWDGRYLYESENRLHEDIINQMDPAELARTRDAASAIVTQWVAPGCEHRRWTKRVSDWIKGVEDLAFDEEGGLYTSDETTFTFYRTRLPGKE
jgi:hypothetical protein